MPGKVILILLQPFCQSIVFLILRLVSERHLLMYKITFQFEQDGLAPRTLNGIEPGQSLLEIALKNDIDLHHNCGGVCACSTCHLYVQQGEQHIEALSDKEEDFIDRAVNPRLNSRLGCQCLLQEGSGDIIVTLPDQTQFLGE